MQGKCDCCHRAADEAELYDYRRLAICGGCKWTWRIRDAEKPK